MKPEMDSNRRVNCWFVPVWLELGGASAMYREMETTFWLEKAEEAMAEVNPDLGI